MLADASCARWRYCTSPSTSWDSIFSEFSHEQMMMVLVVCSPVVWNSGGISAEGDAILLGIPKNSKPLGPQNTFSTKWRLIPCGSNISGMISATQPRKSIQRRTELCGWSLLVKIYRKDVKCRQHIPTIFNPDVGLFLQKRCSLTWDFKVLFVNQVIPLIQVFLRSKHCNCTLPRDLFLQRWASRFFPS